MIENLIANLDKVKVNDSIKPNILEGYKKEATPLNYKPLCEAVDIESAQTEKLTTINEKYEGEKHPETEVSYERKVVETPEGIKEGVFPQFESEFTADLPNELLEANDYQQFKHSNEELKKAIEADPELASKFDEEQLDQIENGDTPPDGYTWHHSEETGKMELVDSETHAVTRHTGGKAIWGGGSLNR